jgi:hypothetical protein
MDVRMMLERLAPGVEDGEDAEFGAKMAGIGGEFAQGFRGRPEQYGVDHGLVLEGDLGDGRRQGEDDVEIRSGQEFGLARLEPTFARRRLTFWTMTIPAAVVSDADGAAIVALFDMAAQRRCAAGGDGAHDATFAATEMAGAGLAESIAITTKDIRQFDRIRHDPLQAGGMMSISNPSKGLVV